ncbi:hypothetical protein FQZ97_1014640 [compost metagenome]
MYFRPFLSTPQRPPGANTSYSKAVANSPSGQAANGPAQSPSRVEESRVSAALLLSMKSNPDQAPSVAPVSVRRSTDSALVLAAVIRYRSPW